MNFVPCELSRLMIDESSQSGQMVLLRELHGHRTLPIVIGIVEAWAISQKLSDGATFPRPLTHDLLQHTLEALEATLERVLITKLEEGTFFAELEIRRADGTLLTLDARPSDSIALSIRTQSPIFVAESVLSQACEDSENS